MASMPHVRCRRPSNYSGVAKLTEHVSAEAYFSAFTQSVATTRKEIQDFKDALAAEESKKVFAHAAASKRAKPQGIKPWRYSDDPEWTTVKRVKREAKGEEPAPK